MSNIRSVMAKMQIDIALIQEPWQWNGKIKGLQVPGFSIFSAATNNKVRTCVVVNNNLNAFFLSNLSCCDLTAIKIKHNISGKPHEIVLASVYLPYDSILPPPTSEMAALVTYCEQNNLQLLMSMDANAHHICWGSSDTNFRGKELLEYFTNTSLVVLNNGNEPTFITKTRKEVIDLTLSTTKLANSITDWLVSKEVSMSDHRLIEFSINCQIILETTVKRNPRKANWVKYSDILDNLSLTSHTPLTIEDLEFSASELSDAIVTAFNSSCPISKPRLETNPPWWSNRLKTLRGKLRSLENKVKHHPDQFFDLMKDAKRQYKNELRTAQRNSWKTFCGEIETLSATSRLTKAFSVDKNAQLGTILLDDGTSTVSHTDTIKHLMSTHFPNCDFDNQKTTLTTNSAYSDRNWSLASEIINMDKMKWAISTFMPYKSAGPDGIFPIMLQKLNHKLLAKLAQNFKSSLILGYIPTAWQFARVVFIPKPGKDTYNSANSFRPISLTSFVLKTIERLCDRYLRDITLHENPLHKTQHAYLSGKSVETALHNVVSRIEKSFHFKQDTLSVFLDIEGAFNKMSFNSLKSSAERFGINTMLINWMINMLQNRTICCDSKGVNLTARVVQGCPQGGVLSPLMWCLVIDGLLNKLNSLGYHTIGFADDIAIIISGKDEQTTINVMQQALKLVEKWCSENQLSVNPSKTAMILFTHKRKYELSKDVILYNEALQLVSEVKYLGVTLDRKLLFNKHLEYKANKSIKAFWQCRRAFGKTWGLSPKVIYWIYTVMIRPMLTFGSLVWWPRARLKTSAAMLQKVQRLACMCITGAIKTAPTSALETFLNLPPLALFIEGEALSTALRMLDNNEWIKTGTQTGHALILTKSNLIDTNLFMKSDSTKPIYSFDKAFKVIIPKKEEWQVENHFTGTCINIYTDGSRTEDRSGAGIYSNEENINISTPLGKFASVFQAELHAILQGAQICLEKETKNKNLRFFSDSQAALHALDTHVTRSILVKNCQDTLNQLSQHNSVELFWIPSHSGFQGNELADKLARKGSDSLLIGPEPALGVSNSSKRTSIQSRINILHTSNWESLLTCRQAKSVFKRPNKHDASFLINIGRRKLKTLVNVLIGHCFRNHLHTIRVIESPLCRGCNMEIETMEHFLCQCPALQSNRTRYLGAPYTTIDTIKESKLKEVEAFIERSNWFNEDHL